MMIKRIKFVFLSLLVLLPTIILPSFASYHQTANIQSESLKNKKVSYKEIRKRKHGKNKPNLKKQISLSIPADGLALYFDAMSIDGNNSPGNPNNTLSTWTDLSGNGNTGILTNISLPFASNSGWSGSNTILSDPSALRLDGTNDYVLVPSSPSLNISSNITIISWVKHASSSGHIHKIFHYRRTGTMSGEAAYQLRFSDATGSANGKRLLFQTNTASGGWKTAQTSADVAVDTDWHQYGASVTNGSVTFYVDGSPVSGSGSVDSTFATGDQGYVGARVDAMEYLNASIANVRIYNRTLSADEVTQSYLSEKDYYLSVLASNRVLDVDASNYDNAGTSASSSTSTTTWTDRSGNANNGTLTNFASLNPSSATSGWDGTNIVSNPSVLKFDGTNDYVLTGSNIGISGNSARTISFFFKPTSSTGRQTIVNWGMASDGQQYWVEYNGFTGGPNNIYVGGWNNDVYTTATLPIGFWHQVAVVYSGTTPSQTKIYYNGTSQPIAFNTTGLVTLNTTDAPVSIGYDSVNNRQPFSGQIANVRIYNTALSADQVRTNYLAEAAKFNNAPLKPAIASASRSSSSQVNQDTFTFTADYNETLTVNFACQDPDAADTATLSTITTPQVGSFTASSASNPTTATYIYTPSASYINMNYSFSVRCTDSRGTVSPPLNLLVKGPDRYPSVAPAAVAPPASQPVLPALPEANSVQTVNATPTATPVQNITNTNNGSSASQGTTVSAPSINTVPSRPLPPDFVPFDLSRPGGLAKPIKTSTPQNNSKQPGIDLSVLKDNPPVKTDFTPSIDFSKQK